jgi:hypothetical protein
MKLALGMSRSLRPETSPLYLPSVCAARRTLTRGLVDSRISLNQYLCLATGPNGGTILTDQLC